MTAFFPRFVVVPTNIEGGLAAALDGFDEIVGCSVFRSEAGTGDERLGEGVDVVDAEKHAARLVGELAGFDRGVEPAEERRIVRQRAAQAEAKGVVTALLPPRGRPIAPEPAETC